MGDGEGADEVAGRGSVLQRSSSDDEISPSSALSSSSLRAGEGTLCCSEVDNAASLRGEADLGLHASSSSCTAAILCKFREGPALTAGPRNGNKERNYKAGVVFRIARNE